MWLSGNWLVPHLDGQPYSDKPPLLFWLITLAWSVTGPSALAARLIALAAGAGSCLLTGLIARQLWPGLRGVGPWATAALAATGLFSLFSSLVMFDGLLTLSVLLSVLGMLLVWRRGRAAWWALVAFGLGLGVLAKGPVALLHLLAVGGVASFWIAGGAPGGRRRWYLGLAAAVAGGAVLALAWAVPAAIAGGAEYRHMILWGQTAGRVEHAFAHARPWWFFLALLPVVVFPWGWWPPLWRWARRRGGSGDGPALRFCVLWFVVLFVAFSAISGKQIHYLLPVLPSLALIAARGIVDDGVAARRRDLVVPVLPMLAVGMIAPLYEIADALGLSAHLSHAAAVLDRLRLDWPSWGLLVVLAALVLGVAPRVKAQAAGLAAAWAATLVAVHLVAAPAFSIYDWSRLAPAIRAHQACGVAWVGDYAGEIGFVARVTRPVESLPIDQLAGWLAAHPGGIAIAKRFDPSTGTDLPAPDRILDYRGRRLALWIAPGAAAACP